MRKTCVRVAVVLAVGVCHAVPSAQRGGGSAAPAPVTILKPARVFDG